jgi:hypothetical protein
LRVLQTFGADSSGKYAPEAAFFGYGVNFGRNFPIHLSKVQYHRTGSNPAGL